MAKTSLNIDENVEGLLCYVLGWITGLVFYLLEKENRFVRFHAMQSILTFLPLTIIAWLFGWLGSPKVVYEYHYGRAVPAVSEGIPILTYLSWLIWIISIILWIVLMIKAYQGERYKLPVVGEIAEKHA